MAKSKRKLGSEIEVAEGGTVRRPSGEEVTVTGGSYILDAPGTFVVDGSEIEVGGEK